MTRLRGKRGSEVRVNRMHYTHMHKVSKQISLIKKLKKPHSQDVFSSNHRKQDYRQDFTTEGKYGGKQTERRGESFRNDCSIERC